MNERKVFFKYISSINVQVELQCGYIFWRVKWDEFGFSQAGIINISLCFSAPACVNVNAVQISFDVACY